VLSLLTSIPYVPEIIIGTLTLSILKSVQNLISPIISCGLYSMATSRHPEPLPLEITFASSPSRLIYKESLLQGHGVPPPQVHHRAHTILNTYKGVLFKLESVATKEEIIISIMAAVACRFIQDRHAGRYFGSKRMTVLVRSIHGPTAQTP